MLSRGTSSASQQPRRAKSTPSVRPEATLPIMPSPNEVETTHQQALTAANLAFERANERAMAKKAPNAQDTTSTANNDSAPKLGRRQSVRFTGPSAIPLRNRSITRREAPDYRTSHHPIESHLEYEPHSVEPSISSNEKVWASLTQPIGEFGESDNASAPSSYRRLRKVKSMFSPGKAPSAVFSDGQPNSRRHFHRQSLQSSNAYHEPLRVPDPRLRKSYSFLRGVTDRISTSSRQYIINDAAVQLARDQYLRQLEEQRLNEQPSLLGLGSRRKSHKAFRRTVRTSSTNSYGSAIASPMPSVAPPTIKDLGHRARSFSHTIKRKIKRVFKRSSDTEDTIPVQQIKAGHPHYGDYILTSNGKEQRYPLVPEPDAELLLRVSSRESVTYTAPTCAQKDVHPGSIRSAHSDDEESNNKSRVTSWTNSTAANTVNLPHTLERKRLSIIKEDGGPHQPSSSAHQYEGTSGGYASFRQPVRQISAGRVSGPIDPKRIFSALQKKIDENNRKAALDDSESGTDSSSGQRKARTSTRTPRRTSSIRKSAKAKPKPHSRPRRAKISNPTIFSPSAMDSFNDSFSHRECLDPDREYKPQDFSDLQNGLTPQQIAEMKEHGISLPKRPLHEVKSAFFPPSVRIEKSSPSPYRRAMHASGETEAESKGDIHFEDRPRSQGRWNGQTGRLRNSSVTESASVYSRSSGGNNPKAARSSISLALSESSGEAGTAIIMTDHPSKREQSILPVVTQQRNLSVASSRNWRNFMATQVASLEDFGMRHEKNDDELPNRDSGHKRENAQLNSDEVNIGRLQSPHIKLNQPLAMDQSSSSPRTSANHKVSHLLGDRSPLRSIGLSGNAGNAKRNDSASWVRNAEPSLKTSNVENERHALGRVHETSSGLQQRNSNSSIKLQTEQKNSPLTVNARYSLERAERLRRLKSNSGTSLENPFSQSENETPRHTQAYEKDHDSDGPIVPQPQAGTNHSLVNSFLKNRRSVMRMSEDSGTEPLFL